MPQLIIWQFFITRMKFLHVTVSSLCLLEMTLHPFLPLKDNFDETFGGMETALVEVQRRGKAMMNTVKQPLSLICWQICFFESC